MDDLLYTLFIIAWIAYGIYKGVKKNKQPQKKNMPIREQSEEVPKESKVERAFESIFNEVFDLPDDENDKIPHPYASEKVEKKAEKASNYEIYAENDVLDSYKGSDNISSVFDDDIFDITNDEESNKIFDNQTEEDVNEQENTVFDLRQAVIHQVILQRPY